MTEHRFRILDYSSRYGDAFRRLNYEWLERYCRAEPVDRIILSDPETRLILESHKSLASALALYESAGFRHEPRPSPSEYERSDIYGCIAASW